jgi:hypothetical protein
MGRGELPQPAERRWIRLEREAVSPWSELAEGGEREAPQIRAHVNEQSGGSQCVENQGGRGRFVRKTRPTFQTAVQQVLAEIRNI